MAFDPTLDAVIMYGGEYWTNGFPFTLADTWKWDGQDWTELFSNSSPGNRSGHGMVYDGARNQILMFGGSFEGSSYYRPSYIDTWAWRNGAWILLNPSSTPPARLAFGMAYDALHEQVLIYGGYAGGSNILADTWTWDGNGWTQQYPQTNPGAIGDFAMSYDSVEEVVLAQGGYGAGYETPNSYVWDGTNWSINSQGFPGVRAQHAMVFDPIRNQILMFGMVYGAPENENDTWVWGSEVVAVPNALSAVAGNSNLIDPNNAIGHLQEIYDASQFSAFGGPRSITEIRFRPKASSINLNLPRYSWSLSNVQITMAVTNASIPSVNKIFVNNLGTSPTVVFNGGITLSSSFTTSNQLTADFDIVIPLQVPFSYDPTAGNLVLDIVNFSPVSFLNLAFDRTLSQGYPLSLIIGPTSSGTGFLQIGSGFVTEFGFQ